MRLCISPNGVGQHKSGRSSFFGQPFTGIIRLVGCTYDYVSRVSLLRRHGFRVAIDMRKSWQTPLNDSLRLLIDTIRVDARTLDANPGLLDIIEVADASGVLIVAENAHWRDGEYLANLGIHAATHPKADA